MLHEIRNYKENNSKACNSMPKYNIIPEAAILQDKLLVKSTVK
jgi:hypothetical protein